MEKIKSTNIRLRKSKERGFEDFGWTDNWMTFSFANYHDAEWMRFGPIRVIVENHIQPHQGFQAHPHEDMEILTYVSSGILTHGDNMGNTEPIGPGEMQRLTAGRGIVHSEENKHDQVEHNIQIWILPNKAGLRPGYEMKRWGDKERSNTLRLYVSPEGRNNSMRINQDADIFAGTLKKDAVYRHQLKPGRGCWIQLIHGSLTINEELQLSAGDGAGITDISTLALTADEEAELLLFDVAMDFETPYDLH